MISSNPCKAEIRGARSSHKIGLFCSVSCSRCDYSAAHNLFAKGSQPLALPQAIWCHQLCERGRISAAKSSWQAQPLWGWIHDATRPGCTERGRARPSATRERDQRCIHSSTPSGSSLVRPRLSLAVLIMMQFSRSNCAEGGDLCLKRDQTCRHLCTHTDRRGHLGFTQVFSLKRCIATDSCKNKSRSQRLPWGCVPKVRLPWGCVPKSPGD